MSPLTSPPGRTVYCWVDRPFLVKRPLTRIRVRWRGEASLILETGLGMYVRWKYVVVVKAGLST